MKFTNSTSAIIPRCNKGFGMHVPNVFHFFRAWQRYNSSLRELNSLTDRELADIGISRSDIPRIAVEHAWS
jgi:uncharacterized protein YjiS (DUF1127 family)